MKQNKEVKLSYWAHHLTTVVSVTLVLLMLGLTALVWIGADTETHRLKERLELTVILNDSVPSDAEHMLVREISAQPYAKDVTLVTSRQALDEWTAETGENLEELFGVNPLASEISFRLRSGYASPENIDKIKTSLERVPQVREVASPDASTVDAMNRNVARLTVVLCVVAAIMLLISFVLINNTVHLAIYARRFTIHTMRLVGATNGFIRRPIVLNNLLAGLVSGVIASGITVAALLAAEHGGLHDIASYISWPAFGIVAGGMAVLGMAICACAAWISSTIYLKKDYDKLFH